MQSDGHDKPSEVGSQVGAIMGAVLALLVSLMFGLGRLEIIVVTIVLGTIGAWVGDMAKRL